MQLIFDGKPSISIHVLRVEDDFSRQNHGKRVKNFNPRPPCGGRRDGKTKARKADAFQSTSSVWRTTNVERK